MKKVGLIVNPIAGMGGRVGLKGTDGEFAQAKATELGAKPESTRRAMEAKQSLIPVRDEIEIVAYPEDMGETAARSAGFSPTVIGQIVKGSTTFEDTRRAALDMTMGGVDLLIFVGGDGTARDILDAVDTNITTLGVPAGVKLYSAVYGTTSQHAGRVALSYLRGDIVETRDAEVMDVDENAFREGFLMARLYGYLNIPDEKLHVQAVKSGGNQPEGPGLSELGKAVMETIVPGVLYIMGPGTTVAAIKTAMGIDGSLLGIDVVKDNQLLARDVGENNLLDLIGVQDVKIIISVIGGQGYLFGRGNQQISPEVLRKVGRSNIIIAATVEKLTALHGRPLLVDTGDLGLDTELSGYWKIITGRNEYSMHRVSD